MNHFLFNGWTEIARTLGIGVLAYAGLIAILRCSGKRTLSKMNAFDLVVTVALGSTLATILLDAKVALAEGLTALALLVALQFTVTWTSVRINWVRSVVTGEPTMLAYRGEMLPRALRRERIAENEIHAAVRQAGFSALAEAEAVVLETDGSISVIQTVSSTQSSSLEPVKTFDKLPGSIARSLH